MLSWATYSRPAPINVAIRGQFMISPEGKENVKKFLDSKKH